MPRPTLGSSTGRSERVVSSPISKEKSPPSALTTSRSVVTVTRSFSSNGLFGTKLAPAPSECAFIVPGWSPLREPLTVTVPRAAASPPRNEIVVLGWAVSVPGIGYAENVGGSCCAWAGLKVMTPTAMLTPAARVSFHTTAGKPPLLKKLRVGRAPD